MHIVFELDKHIMPFRVECKRESCGVIHPLPPVGTPDRDAFLNHRRVDVDARVRFAIARTYAWRAALSLWRSSLSPVDDAPIHVARAICGKSVAVQGMGAHPSRTHHHFRLARLFCAGDGRCPVCVAAYPSRLRRMHHVQYSTTACLEAFTTSHCAPWDAAEAAAWDAADAEVRRAALRIGRS